MSDDWRWENLKHPKKNSPWYHDRELPRWRFLGRWSARRKCHQYVAMLEVKDGWVVANARTRLAALKWGARAGLKERPCD